MSCFLALHDRLLSLLLNLQFWINTFNARYFLMMCFLVHHVLNDVLLSLPYKEICNKILKSFESYIQCEISSHDVSLSTPCSHWQTITHSFLDLDFGMVSIHYSKLYKRWKTFHQFHVFIFIPGYTCKQANYSAILIKISLKCSIYILNRYHL